MRLKNFLLVVEDMERAKSFYKELFGLDVMRDFDTNVILTQGLVLQERKSWEQAVGEPVSYGGKDTVLYFEEYDLHVRPYLTLEEAMGIGELVVQANNPIEQEINGVTQTILLSLGMMGDTEGISENGTVFLSNISYSEVCKNENGENVTKNYSLFADYIFIQIEYINYS